MSILGKEWKWKLPPELRSVACSKMAQAGRSTPRRSPVSQKRQAMAQPAWRDSGRGPDDSVLDFPWHEGLNKGLAAPEVINLHASN